MIEGGSAGGSAQAQAAERRAHAARLQAEADRLDVVAGDERATAARLAALPDSYVILHDLTLPEGRGRVDHLVVGPGGAFVVLTRRVEGEVAPGAGRSNGVGTPLVGLVDAARRDAQLLTQALSTPVVPVIGIVGPDPQGGADRLDVADFQSVEGALVCPAAQVATVVSRGSHTLLPSTQVREVADRAVLMLTVAGTRPRAAAPAGAPLVTPGSAASLAPPPPPPAPRAAAPPADLPEAAAGAHTRRPSEHPPRSKRFVIAAIASACLVAFAAGSLLRVLFIDDPATSATSVLSSGESTDPGGSAGPTTIEVATSSPPGSTVTPVTVKVAAVPPPKVAVLPVCQTPGAGWLLVPAWPGDLAGLERYDVEVLGPDGSWSTVSSFTTQDTVAAAITGQQPNVTLTVRIIAVMADGSRSPGSPTPVLTPATAC